MYVHMHITRSRNCSTRCTSLLLSFNLCYLASERVMFARSRLLSLGWLLMLTLPLATRAALSPSLYHVKFRGGVPLSVQLKVALPLSSQVADSGSVSISMGTAEGINSIIKINETIFTQRIWTTEVLRCSYTLLHNIIRRPNHASGCLLSRAKLQLIAALV